MLWGGEDRRRKIIKESRSGRDKRIKNILVKIVFDFTVKECSIFANLLSKCKKERKQYFNLHYIVSKIKKK